MLTLLEKLKLAFYFWGNAAAQLGNYEMPDLEAVDF